MTDLLIVGAGPAGYVAAIRAAQLGLKVKIIDRLAQPGGVCLNWGCIPTKSLAHLAERYRFIKRAKDYGFEIESYGVNWEKLIKHTRKTVGRLARGVRGLFNRYDIQLINDSGRLIAPGMILTESGERFSAGSILLASGATARVLPGIKPNGDRIMTSREAVRLKKPLADLMIFGGGAIGVEFASIYQSFGCQVRLFELADQLLPGAVDSDLAALLARKLQAAGIRLELNTEVEEVYQKADRVYAKTVEGEVFTASAGLLALGMQPHEVCCWDEELNLQTDEAGWVEVDHNYQTTLPGVYAAGDMIGSPWLAHVASEEGRRVAEKLAGLEVEPLNYQQLPAAVFSQPQVATFGMTEQQAGVEYDKVKSGKFPFAALGRARAEDDTEGFVKLLFAGDSNRLVGAQIIGSGAADLMAEITMGASLEATVEELINLVHIHPTRSEAIQEAALSAVGQSLHNPG